MVKLEIDDKSLNLIVGALTYVDPTGFFSRKLIDDLRKQYKEQMQKKAIDTATPPEDVEMINKLENAIKQESIQPTGFDGNIGELVPFKPEDKKK